MLLFSIASNASTSKVAGDSSDNVRPRSDQDVYSTILVLSSISFWIANRTHPPNLGLAEVLYFPKYTSELFELLLFNNEV